MRIFRRVAELESEIARLKSEHEAESSELRVENAELRAENAGLCGEIERKASEIAQKDAEIEKKDLLIKHYIEQLRIAQHRMFGASSERSEMSEIPEQMGLFNEPEAVAEAVVAETEDETEQVTYTRRKRRGKREEFYEGIPVKQVVHELPEEERI